MSFAQPDEHAEAAHSRCLNISVRLIMTIGFVSDGKALADCARTSGNVVRPILETRTYPGIRNDESLRFVDGSSVRLHRPAIDTVQPLLRTQQRVAQSTILVSRHIHQLRQNQFRLSSTVAHQAGPQSVNQSRLRRRRHRARTPTGTVGSCSAPPATRRRRVRFVCLAGEGRRARNRVIPSSANQASSPQCGRD